MTRDAWYGDDDGEAGRFVPLYVLVNGRTSPRNTSLDLATQVIGAARRHEDPGAGIRSDRPSLLELDIHRRTRRVPELPAAVTKILVDVLLDRKFLAVGTAAEDTVPDRELLETILARLEKL